MNKVFISYHRADTRQKNRLLKELSKHGIKYYVVPNEVSFNGLHNQTICQSILRELDECNCVICLVGKETYERPHVDHELKYALSKRKGMVVLLIENRRDSIYSINHKTFPTRLDANLNYIILAQFASGIHTIKELINCAIANSNDVRIPINNKHCLQLRNKLYYEN